VENRQKQVRLEYLKYPKSRLISLTL